MTACASRALAMVFVYGKHLQLAVCQRKIDAYENRRFDVSGTLEYQTNRISRKRT
jgi:hypothetical protein